MHVSEQQYPDVLIQADPEKLKHKRREFMDDPYSTICHWRVSGTPQRTGRGGAMLFAHPDRAVWGYATITSVEEGRINHKPIHDMDALIIDIPIDPPNQGFAYITEEMVEGAKDD
jgi:hypothetical protein